MHTCSNFSYRSRKPTCDLVRSKTAFIRGGTLVLFVSVPILSVHSCWSLTWSSSPSPDMFNTTCQWEFSSAKTHGERNREMACCLRGEVRTESLCHGSRRESQSPPGDRLMSQSLNATHNWWQRGEDLKGLASRLLRGWLLNR